MARLSGGGGKPQPKKSRDMDDWYLLQEEKRQRFQRELEQKRKEAAQKAAAQKESMVLPPWINPDEYDPQTGGMDTPNNNKPASRGGQRDMDTTGESTDDTSVYVTDFFLNKQESGSRNTVDPSKEVAEDIGQAIKDGDRDAFESNLTAFINLGPNYAAYFKYDDQFQIYIRDCQFHVVTMGGYGKRVDKTFSHAEDVLDYVGWPPKHTNLTDEIKLMVATIYGEAAECSPLSWEAIANVIINRVGNREWSKYNTTTEIIQNTGFNAYRKRNQPYTEAEEYLNNRDGSNTQIENLIGIVESIYYGNCEDITGGAVLFYSPQLMGGEPPWDFSKLEEIIIPGTENDDFKFYKYK